MIRCRAGEWLVTIRAQMFGICALVSLFLFNPFCSAGELEELSISKVDGEYRIRIVSVLDAPADYVYYVITDYRHAYRINPSITEIEILPSEVDGVIRVRNLSEHCAGPFCFRIDWAGDIVEPRHGHLEVKTIPELSSFESGSAVWEVQPVGNRTRVLHESSLKPDFFIPPVIGDVIMKNNMKDDTLDTFNKIECYAQIVLEMEMESEPELLEALVSEGRDCVNLQG